jgi:hypothetical protein
MSPRDFTKNVLIRAYRTMLRSGWEDGLTHEEMAKELLAVLKNMDVSDKELFRDPMPRANYQYPDGLSPTHPPPLRERLREYAKNDVDPKG